MFHIEFNGTKCIATCNLQTYIYDLWGGVKRSKLFFLKVVLLQIELKDSMQANSLPLQTLLTLLFGAKGQIFFSCHVAYQIKGNEMKIILQANYLSGRRGLVKSQI